MLPNLFAHFKSTQFSNRCYFIGTAIAILGFGAVLIDSQLLYLLQICGLLAAMCYLAGFATWISPYLRAGWASPIGTPVLILLHSFALLLAIFPARLFISVATNLPPQYFDVTVAICTLIFYPAMWLIIFSIIALVLLVVFIIGSMLLQWTTFPGINEALILFGKFFPEASSQRIFFDRGRKKWTSNLNNHACGSLVICMFSLFACAGYFSITTGLAPAIKWIAYLADFQSATMYPGVDVSKRFRLMDNGIVAYAERKGTDINITVGYFQSPTKN